MWGLLKTAMVPPIHYRETLSKCLLIFPAAKSPAWVWPVNSPVAHWRPMGDDLPKRFLVYRNGAGVIAHGVEWCNGSVVLQGKSFTNYCNSMAWLVKYDLTEDDMVIQYDVDEEEDAA